MNSFPGLCAVIPALDEEGSIGAVVGALREFGVAQIIVADNGSTDATAAVARAAGAKVVPAARRGYGSACLAGLSVLPEGCRAVVFCDADGADDLRSLGDVVSPVLAGAADLVIGSRALGGAEPGALSWPQRSGNLVAAILMRILYGVRVTDLGPFRCVSSELLSRMGMHDPDFGWTAEMQVKAYRLQARVVEIPVMALARTAGQSKISGRFIAVFRAGWAIISTILRYRAAALPIARTSLGEAQNPPQAARSALACAPASTNAGKSSPG